ncbi:MAG: RNA polymerase sigma factor [bacterium]|nr:RNA polymerase sigma factor [bacterium]
MSRELGQRSDEELAALWGASADETVSDEIYRRYRRRIYLWCHGFTHDPDEAVDLTQEIFIKLFRHLEGFAGRSRFSTWVYAVARNHCLARQAQRGVAWRKRLASLEDVDVEDERCAEEVRRSDTEGVLARLLDRAHERMAADELEAFVLHYRDGLTVNEVTRTLGCDNATGARTLIQNARRKFRRLVAREDRRAG